MSVRGANPGEIYEDDEGHRWLVTSVCNEPTVGMQRIEPRWHDGGPAPFSQRGGVSGLMWKGFRKIAEAPNEEG